MKYGLLERRLATRTTGFGHVVLYKTNPNNPYAVQKIIENANKYLTSIPGLREFIAAPRFDTGRVVDSNGYDVALNFVFDSRRAMQSYMNHPNHRRFVEFVLNGWMLEGSDKPSAYERRQEFINHVLNGSSEQKRKWGKDPEVPDSERVWNGEQVFDFG